MYNNQKKKGFVVERLEIDEYRDNWENIIKTHGLVFSDSLLPDGTVDHYWQEQAVYEVTVAEAEEIQKATEDCYEMALETVDFIIDESKDKDSPYRFSIPREYNFAYEPIMEYVKYSFDEYNNGNDNFNEFLGRFDFIYGGEGYGKPKMLEYNADTPTCLIESSLAQRFWLQELFPDCGQYNYIHEMIIEYFEHLLEYKGGHASLYGMFSNWDDTGEELMHTSYILDCAQQAGWDIDITKHLISAETVSVKNEHFVDHDGDRMENIFKLYPWEDMLIEDFGYFVYSQKQSSWLEPVWKVLMSTKMLPAAMYHLFPDSEYLLESYMDTPHGLESFVKKPLYGREGENVEIYLPDESIIKPGDYGAEGYAFQKYCPLPVFEGVKNPVNRALIGSWTVDGEAAGIGMRESTTYITDYDSRFVPHIIVE